MANRVSSYLGKLDRLKLDSLKIDSKDAQSVVAGSGRLRRNYDVETDRDLLAKMIVNFTKHVPREMWGEQLTEMYDAAGGDADRMAREAFDASFCSDPDRYDAYFERNRSVAEMRRDPLVRLTESVRVQRFTGGWTRPRDGFARRWARPKAVMQACSTTSALRKGLRSIPTPIRPCA